MLSARGTLFSVIGPPVPKACASYVFKPTWGFWDVLLRQ